MNIDTIYKSVVYIVAQLGLYTMKQCNLSPKDEQLILEISKGNTYKQIARVMNVSPRTIEWRMQKIIKNTGCRNKIDVINHFSFFKIPKVTFFQRLLRKFLWCR